jgi:alkylhydroperoxidase family enzyme
MCTRRCSTTWAAVSRTREIASWSTSRGLTLAPHEAPEAVADLRAHLSAEEVYDAIAVVALLNFANRAALATGITTSDDLP